MYLFTYVCKGSLKVPPPSPIGFDYRKNLRDLEILCDLKIFWKSPPDKKKVPG